MHKIDRIDTLLNVKGFFYFYIVVIMIMAIKMANSGTAVG